MAEEEVFGPTQSFGESTELDHDAMTLGDLDDEPFPIVKAPRRVFKGRAKSFPFHKLSKEVVGARYPYDSLANVVLGANQDVKFHRTLTDRKLASKYADAHRLQLGEDKDYNEDGVNDVILFNKFGDPVVINGYALANTEYPYRRAFYGANPKKSDRMRAGGYNKWLKDSFIKDNADAIDAWGKQGIKVRSIRDIKSVRSDINSFIKERISEVIAKFVKPPALAQFVLSLFPWFQIYSYLYDAIILEYIIKNKAGSLIQQAENLDDFKRLLKKKGIKDLVNEFLNSQECKGLLSNMLNEAGVVATANIVTGGFDGFIRTIAGVSTNLAEYSTEPELRVQKQVWKEQLAENIDNARGQIAARLNSMIASSA